MWREPNLARNYEVLINDFIFKRGGWINGSVKAHGLEKTEKLRHQRGLKPDRVDKLLWRLVSIQICRSSL